MYRSPHKHTRRELREALIADLEIDLQFSRKNDQDTEEWVAYRKRVETDLDNLRAGGLDPRLG